MPVWEQDQGAGEDGQFFKRLADRADEVKQRCRTVLQAQAEALTTQTSE